jgi:penicillin-binding protein 2
MYGIQKDSGKIDPKKGIMPQPVTALPKFSADGAAVNSQQAAYSTSVADTFANTPSGPQGGDPVPALAALTPTRTEKLLYGRKYT